MLKFALKSLLGACALAGCAGAAAPAPSAGHLASQTELLALMHRVNDWQVSHPVMSAGDRDWERATWYTGVMSAWKETRDRRFFNQALAWGRQHNWQVGTEEDGSNRLFCVETWLELFAVEKDPAMFQPAVQWLATPAPNSPAGAKVWYLEDNRHYVDSLYGAPAFVMLAQVTHDQKYLEIMQAFFDDVKGQLYDRETGLFYRDPRFIGKKTANGKKILWSRGNGWAFGGLARILENLPKEHPARNEYLGMFRRMASELVKRQGADGLWRMNLDDPEQVPGPETSGTGFFCYGLAWGINHGILARAEYLPAVARAWTGLTRNVTPEGKVLGGQQVGDQPVAVNQAAPREYVAGTVLLAASQVYTLSGKR